MINNSFRLKKNRKTIHYLYVKFFLDYLYEKMKRKVWLWFTLSPVIVGVLWLFISILFRVLGTAGVISVGASIAKNFINRWLWIAALISIPLLIIGIVFLAWSKSKDKNFTIKEIIRYSRKTSKKHMSKYLLWFGIYLVIQMISNSFGYSTETGHVYIENMIISVVVYLAALRLWLWFKSLSLNIVNEAKSKFSDVFVDFKKAIRYLWAYILVFLIVVVWIILLVIPWIIFAIKLSMVPYLILDKNMWPIDAIKTSWKMTRWYLGDILCLIILCRLINILWFLAVMVWLLRTIPLSMIATASIYKKILALQKK